MKIQLSESKISALEEVSETKITRNGDQIIREVAEIAKRANEKGSEKSIEVCDFTESMANNEEETEVKNWDFVQELKTSQKKKTRSLLKTWKSSQKMKWKNSKAKNPNKTRRTKNNFALLDFLL